ncbi:uncharacterized protein [Maniola hyperantus]|uniref:uncharacterized protein n=1 Tax=Aphantopus hyperantus TaxID=2795564 RepID=UPI0015696E8F|nr:uncharacterized protein LOC117988988 [Maniola hyperantus]
MDGGTKRKTLQDILTEEQINCIISQNSKTEFKLLKHELRSATEGMSGFVGDHIKLTLHIKEGDSVKKKKMHLFVKAMPSVNAAKARFIKDNNFFGIESSTYEIFENFADEEFSNSSPWGVKALIHNHNTLVLPDLSVEGYRTPTRHLDLDHVLVTLKSMARFHAAFAKHQTKVNANPELHEEYACFLRDPLFVDCGFLRAAIRTTTCVIKEFSTNIKKYPVNLEESMTKWFLNACDSLRNYEDTLNVIIHKDLWKNNVMFNYSETEPVNAVLIDFQCARYAPPAIDVLVFLYFTTSREFRQKHERDVLDHYYSVFWASIDELTRQRMVELNYNRQEFFKLCEKLRPAGIMVPLSFCPFNLMSTAAAQESFNDPNTFYKHISEDRCDLVLEYARKNEYYKIKVLEISEEFVERNLL